MMAGKMITSSVFRLEEAFSQEEDRGSAIPDFSRIGIFFVAPKNSKFFWVGKRQGFY